LRRHLEGYRGLTFAVGAFVLLTLGEAAGQQLSDDPTTVCERAARQAERDWHLPQGVLAAIGLVESGRRAPAGAFPVIWPWTINAEGQGFYQPTKAAAVGMVRALQRRGVRVIDVGCFQVDLFYHPYAFSSLEEAFDPEANARAAARILSLRRLGSTGWDGAIAAYHSAVPLFGAAYLQKVRAVWPWIVAHPSWGEPEVPAAYAVLLSAQARLVRVVTPFDPSPERPEGLSPFPPTDRLASGAVWWLHRPAVDLPRVLTPASPR
jgi:NAD(P)-dependent dehydrogenase (short-subunit alcohol dehydrogenase family)